MKVTRSPFAMVPLWVYDHPEVTPTVLHVYISLAAAAHERKASRSIPAIMERTDLGKSAVYAALAVLSRAKAAIERKDGSLFLPLDEPDLSDSTTVDPDSATVENPSAHVESDSTTVESSFSIEGSRGSSRESPLPPREERGGASPFEDHFWPTYPDRDGKKLHKAKARSAFEKLSIEDQRLAYKGAMHFAAAIASGGRFGVPDAHRWLTNREWLDWQEPAQLSRKSSHGRPIGMDAVAEYVRREGIFDEQD